MLQEGRQECCSSRRDLRSLRSLAVHPRRMLCVGREPASGLVDFACSSSPSPVYREHLGISELR